LVSEIGFGCMSLGDDSVYNNTLIHQALDLGVNLFDTADLYQHGMNEIKLGKALTGKRKQAFIASKVGNRWLEDGSGWDWNPKKDYILAAVEKSLGRLQTDYIDLYQLHGGTINDPIDESIEAFELLQQQGKIRYYGISSIRPDFIREYVKRSRIVSVMMQYSLLDRRPEESCFPLLLQNEIAVLARGGLAKGLLANKQPADYLNYKKEEVAGLAGILQKFKDTERTMAQTAIRFVLQNPVISSAIVGIRTTEQLMDASGTADSSSLSADEITSLQQVLPVNQYDQHR
jgi:aryl-alcohol dehydrogenase-like predicted oxidoreductase